LTPTAKESAGVWLRQRLCSVLQWCLYDSFDRFRNERRSQQGSYRAFVEETTRPEWSAQFFARYAGIARLAGGLIEQWGDNVLNLLGRLEADRVTLAAYLGLVGDVEIERFERFPSDPHAGGQSVAIIRLQTGHRIVFKPRDQVLAEVWLGATNLAFGDTDSVSAPLVCAGYGWQKLVDDEGPVDQDTLAFSLGRNLALGTALGATDMHFENFVPTAAGLVLVDHETVMSPRIALRNAPWPSAQRSAFRDVADSVLVTGVLPRWSPGPDGKLWNADAFGWQTSSTGAGQFPFLAAPNTDEMHVSRDRGSHRSPDRTMGVGVARDVGTSRLVAAGFSEGWAKLQGLRQDLLALVEQSSAARVRVILRATREYSEMLGQSYMPSYCHDLLDRSLLFERLRRPLRAVAGSDSRGKLVDQEIRALVMGDVPLFTTSASRISLQEASRGADAVAISGVSPLSHARQCLQRLNSRPRLRNDELIVSSVEVHEWPRVTAREARLLRPVRARGGWRGRLAAAELLFDEVRRQAYVSRADGSIALVAATHTATGTAQQLGVADSADVYSGVAGLGLLAAGLQQLRPNRRYRDAAVRVADTLSATLGAAVDAARPERAGAFLGPPGVAYALHLLSDLLGEGFYTEHARGALQAWHIASGDPGDDLDVVSGAAGAAMVRLALAARDGSDREDVLAFVAPRADLLRSSAILRRGLAQWPQIGASQRNGFAHGAAGIASSLARVTTSGYAGHRETMALLTGATVSEVTAIQQRKAGTLRTNQAPEPIPGTGWCYGGAGLLLAAEAMEAGGVVGATKLRNRAVQSILSERLVGDGLCHGLGGSSAVLWRHGARHDDQRLVAAASGLLDEIALRCQMGRTLWVEPTSSLAHSAGLMTGATGVGLALISPELGHLVPRLLAVE
jgi:type 2 lantibiotic biosynthesis protein LanM